MKRALFLILCLKIGTLHASLDEMEVETIVVSRKLCLGWIHRLKGLGIFKEGLGSAESAGSLFNYAASSAARLSPTSFRNYLAAKEKFVPIVPLGLAQRFDSYVDTLRKSKEIN